MINVPASGRFRRQRQAARPLRPGEALPVARRDRPPPLVPGLQIRELRHEDGRLDRLHPEIAAHARVVVALGLPVHPQAPQKPRQTGIVRRDRARVPRASQVLRRIEREGGHRAECPRRALLVGRPDRLAGVFENGDAAASGDFQDRLHVRALAVEMDRLDRLRAGRDGRFEPGRVEVERARLDVHEDGPRVQARDFTGRREEGKGARDHLVPGADTERHQSDEQGVRPGRDPDGVGGPDLGGEGALELLVGGPHHEPAARENLRDAPRDFAVQLRFLASQVEERDRILRVHERREF